MSSNLGGVPQETIPVGGETGVGGLVIKPPTFLEVWGVVFVSIAGVWMLTVAGYMLYFYLHHLSFPPVQTGTVEEYKSALDLHKAASDQFRDSLSFVFDLVVTKTVLPIVTLLLGYLFGVKKG